MKNLNSLVARLSPGFISILSGLIVLAVPLSAGARTPDSRQDCSQLERLAEIPEQSTMETLAPWITRDSIETGDALQALRARMLPESLRARLLTVRDRRRALAARKRSPEEEGELQNIDLAVKNWLHDFRRELLQGLKDGFASVHAGEVVAKGYSNLGFCRDIAPGGGNCSSPYPLEGWVFKGPARQFEPLIEADDTLKISLCRLHFGYLEFDEKSTTLAALGLSSMASCSTLDLTSGALVNRVGFEASLERDFAPRGFRTLHDHLMSGLCAESRNGSPARVSARKQNGHRDLTIGAPAAEGKGLAHSAN